MTTIDVLVKKAPPGNLVSQREPPAAPPDPYSSGCPTRLLLDRIGDKWMVLTLGLIRAIGHLHFSRGRRTEINLVMRVESPRRIV